MDQFLGPKTGLKYQFLDLKTDEIYPFLDFCPKTDVVDYFLDPETDIMGKRIHITKRRIIRI